MKLLWNLLATAVFVEQVSHDILTHNTLPWAGGSTPPSVRDPHPGRTPGGKKPNATACLIQWQWPRGVFASKPSFGQGAPIPSFVGWSPNPPGVTVSGNSEKALPPQGYGRLAEGLSSSKSLCRGLNLSLGKRTASRPRKTLLFSAALGPLILLGQCSCI